MKNPVNLFFVEVKNTACGAAGGSLFSRVQYLVLKTVLANDYSPFLSACPRTVGPSLSQVI